jgi:3-oxoacyl-[acyl-carrier protein] reductase
VSEISRAMDEMRRVDVTGAGRLNERVAIVTGGSSGIGRATCVALAKEGANLVVLGRNPVHLRETVEEIKRQAKIRPDLLSLALDVRQERETNEIVRQTLNGFGRIDILVTCAGILRAQRGALKTLCQTSLEEWDEVLDTNLKGVFFSNRAVLPTMIRQRKGHIINVASTSGLRGLAFDSAYCASKFGVIGLSEALAGEVCQYGVKVQAVLPGTIDTPMWSQNGPLPRPRAMLSAERVADLIVLMLTLPEDTMLVSPVIVPFGVTSKPAWMGNSGSGTA